MTKFSLHQLAKQTILLIPAVRRLYNFSLAIKQENEVLKQILVDAENPSKININLSGDPKTILTSDLPESSDAEYVELERRILYVLGSHELSKLSFEAQISWINEIFSQCVTLLHPKSHVFAKLIDDYLTDIFKSEELSLTAACQLYDSMYGLYWCGAQSLLDMRGFDTYTVPLFRGFLKKKGIVSEVPQKCIDHHSDGLRIGYFCHYAYDGKGNALAPLVSALANAHAKKKNREIFIYCVQWSSPQFIDEFDRTKITVRDFPNQGHYEQLENLVDSIRSDKIDVLVTEVASSIASYVFAKRVALCQMWLEPGYPFWSNPDVDWVLIPGKVWQPWFGIPQNRYSNFRLGIPLSSRGVEPTEDELANARSKLPSGMKVFAVFTRLIKVTPAYLGLVRRILDELPQACMLIVGTGDPRLINSLALEADLEGRLILLNENVDLNIYGRIIDVFLDTFPFVGGLACRDVACHGKPVLSLLSGEWDVLLQNERINSLLTNSKDEYVRKAVQLIRDDGFYDKCVTEQLELAIKLFDNSDMISDVEFAISSSLAI
jgi:hypothetical protein